MPILNVSKSACWGQKTHLGRTEAMKIDVYEIACIWRKGTGYVVLSLSLSLSPLVESYTVLIMIIIMNIYPASANDSRQGTYIQSTKIHVH